MNKFSPVQTQQQTRNSNNLGFRGERHRSKNLGIKTNIPEALAMQHVFMCS